MPHRFDPYAVPPTDAERAELEAEYEAIEKRKAKAKRWASRCPTLDNYYLRQVVQLYERQQAIAEILARKPLPRNPADLWR